MIQIYIFADSHKHFSDSILEYKKRLGKMVEIIQLKPVKKGTPEQIIVAETKILQEKLDRASGYKIVLSPTGKGFSTQDFSQMLGAKKDEGERVVFAIG